MQRLERQPKRAGDRLLYSPNGEFVTSAMLQTFVRPRNTCCRRHRQCIFHLKPTIVNEVQYYSLVFMEKEPTNQAVEVC